MSEVVCDLVKIPTFPSTPLLVDFLPGLIQDCFAFIPVEFHRPTSTRVVLGARYIPPPPPLQLQFQTMTLVVYVCPPPPGLDGSYHPESGGTLMGAAMSVAKNVASNTGTATTAADGTATAKAKPSAEVPVAEKTDVTTNGDGPKVDTEETVVPVPPTDKSNGLVVEVPPEQAPTASKSEAPPPTRKSSFIFNVGGGKQSPERGSATDRRSSGAGGPAVTDRRGSAGGGPSSRGSSPANASGGGSGPIGAERPTHRKKSSEFDELLGLWLGLLTSFVMELLLYS